jgi:hypothetical protein
MQGMDAVVAALITAVVTLVVSGPVAFYFGLQRSRYERLYEQRALVIAKLCELLAAVQRGVVGFTNPFQPGDVDRHEQAAEAQRAFFELVNYYRSVEVWLDPDTCLKIEKFMDEVYLPLGEYMDTLDERGYPLGEQGQRGRVLGRRIMRETQPLRRELIEEFRAILYPPHWSKAPLRFLGRIQPRNRKPTEDATSDATDAPRTPS